MMITYTVIDIKGKHRIVNIPLFIAIKLGYNFNLDNEEYYIYQCDKEKLLINPN